MHADILNIIRTLPHRYPFLLVDRILEVTADTIVGLKNVTYNEPFFLGHFPDHPVMPGVLIIEAMAQVGAYFGFEVLDIGKNTPVYFMGMDKVRFRKPVRPGDQLILKLQLLRRKGYIIKMRGEALVDDRLVAEAELMATMVVPKSSADQ